MKGDPLPRAPIVAWALLVPLVYAPLFLIGERPAAPAWGLLAVAILIAALAAFAQADALARAADALEPYAGGLLGVAIAGFVIASTLGSFAYLASFTSYDQAGLFGQSFWTLLRGHPFANTHETIDGTLGSHFAIHFSPTLLLLTPLYALWPRPITLLAGQALALGLAAVPLYHLARRELGAAGALVIAIALLAVPNFGWGGVNDFRDANFLPVFLLAAVWALERRRWWLLALATLAALGVREDAALTVALLGVWALLRGRLPAGLALIVGALAWMGVVIRVVMPRFVTPGLWIDPSGFIASVLGRWGTTPGAALVAMATHPVALVRSVVNGDSIRYVWHLLAPLLLLPPLFDLAWLPGLAGLGVNLLSSLPWMRDATLYYSIVPATFFTLSTALVAAKVARSAVATRLAATGLAVGLVMLAGTLPSLALSHRPPKALPSAPVAPARRAVGLVPSGAVVYAPVQLYPELCNRLTFDCWYSVGAKARDAGFRGRYDAVILWPEGDSQAPPKDGPLADSLANDARFEPVAGCEPLRVFRRR